MLSRLWNYCSGYVIIKIEGLSFERLMNLAMRNSVKIFDCRRLSYTTMEARVSFFGYKRLCNLLREKDYRHTVLKERGLPFFITTLWKRKYFLLGAVVCAALVYILTSFIWVVEIDPRGNVDIPRLQKLLADMGVKPGLYIGDVSTEDIENRIMIADSSLGWAGVTVNGVILKLEAVEAPKPPVMLDRSIPVNIISSKDAFLYKLTIYDGWAAVKEGKTVKKGELLVSGVNQNANGEIRYTHANASVLGKVWYTGRAGAPIQQTLLKRTGRSAASRFLVIGGWRIPLEESKPPFNAYETETKMKSLNNMYIPVNMVTETYYEMESIEVERDLVQLKQDLQKEAVKRVLAMLPEEANVLNVKLVFIVKADNTTEAQAFIESSEEIGTEERITGS